MQPDTKKTNAYYDSLTEGALCDCGYCLNYRTQIRSEFPKIAAYLDALGVDIEKPFETSPLAPDEKGMLTYCACQYLVFGSCKADYSHKIDDVEIRIASSYPSTGITEPHFVLELSPIRLEYKEVPD